MAFNGVFCPVQQPVPRPQERPPKKRKSVITDHPAHQSKQQERTLLAFRVGQQGSAKAAKLFRPTSKAKRVSYHTGEAHVRLLYAAEKCLEDWYDPWICECLKLMHKCLQM